MLFAPGAAQAATTTFAWGCGGSGGGPCAMPGGLSDVTAVDAGADHGLALKSDGTVVAWGCGFNYGQCNMPSSLAGVTAIAAGGLHSLALKNDGTVVAWGCGAPSPIDVGQCSVPGGLAGVAAISAGRSQSLALKSDGTVVAWGCGALDYGQCNVPGGLAGVRAIAAAYGHSLALKNGGTVVAWGCGAGHDFGQCTVPAALSGVSAIAAGDFHSLALAERLDQTITFGPIADRTFGDPDFVVSATASSGLPVSFSANGACFLSGAIVRVTSAGSCTVTASQPGGLNFNPAPPVSRTFTIARVRQSIIFAPLEPKRFGDPDFVVSAFSSSGLPVSLAASGSCAVSGVSVHLTGAGSCTITASQAGHVNWEPAPDVSQTFTIAKAGQSITFGPLANKRYGAPPFPVGATASSGLAVSFAAGGRCTVRAATVHLTGAGSCTVTASQPGDANYNPAPDVSRTFAIARAPCRVPKVVRKSLKSAKRTIARRHCRTGKVAYTYSHKRKKGFVISQNRRPGRVLPVGSRIDLIVSRGRRR
jgi:hypothetical protein